MSGSILFLVLISQYLIYVWWHFLVFTISHDDEPPNWVDSYQRYMDILFGHDEELATVLVTLT